MTTSYNKTKKNAGNGSKKKGRDKEKNSGLKSRYFSKIKQEFHDIDYANKLNEEEKAWLSKFMNEDLGANFTDKGDQIYKDPNAIKESYNRNNARNRDIYAISRAQGRLIYTEFDPTEKETDESYDPTNDIIDRLDED